jgi:ethanolamine ammonia-lyase small subunit
VSGDLVGGDSGLSSPDSWSALRSFTPARIGLGRAGSSLPTRALLEFQLAHARARYHVLEDLDQEALLGELAAAGYRGIAVSSMAPDRATYIRRPDLGRRLSDESRATLTGAAPASCDLIFVLADGLSALAVARHALPVLERVHARLEAEGWRPGPVVVARQARVAIADEIGALVGARLAVILIGERPGLSAPDSLGAYITWNPRPGRTDAERNCVSNIRPEGLAYDAAASQILRVLRAARAEQRSGVLLGAALVEADRLT